MTEEKNQYDLANARIGERERIRQFINEGYEPFAVDQGKIYFKRKVKGE